MDAALRTTGLRKVFHGGHVALRGLHLEVPGGSVFGYLGPNGAADAATGAVAQVLLGAEFGVVALAVGAATGHRHLAVGVPAALAVGAYVLHAVSLLVPEVDPWQRLSPFHQALAEGPLGAGLPATYLWLVLGTALVLGASLRLLDRRDIAAPG